ncbi:MAG: TIGR01777 family oxidoreductase [Cyclobacteriaceae bacterium]|nr:TIGR01777 family oxidoreductase [Cyclobacteriaceae bacterium]
MSKKVLITGASGLIGSQLTHLLLQHGYRVAHLGRTKRAGSIPAYVWDIHKQEFEAGALHEVDVIINLAGAGVADKRWTAARKKEILESRTKSAALILKMLQTESHQVTAVVSASAIGYYGFGRAQVFEEEAKPGNDFLATVTRHWEEAIDSLGALNVRIVKLRIGIVLSNKGGALTEMARPVRWFAGSPLGTGKQYLSWIHIDDLCNLFIYAVENAAMHGAYNAVSGQWATNKEMTETIGKVLHRPVWPLPVPGFVLKIILGELAHLVLLGSKVSANKIKQSGFELKHTNLYQTVRILLAGV